MKRVMPKATVDIIAPDAGLETLVKYELIVFPSEWTNRWKNISAKREHYRKFISRGGSLLMFQPNPHHFKDETLKVDLLPQTYTVYNWYKDSMMKVLA